MHAILDSLGREWGTGSRNNRPKFFILNHLIMGKAQTIVGGNSNGYDTHNKIDIVCSVPEHRNQGSL